MPDIITIATATLSFKAAAASNIATSHALYRHAAASHTQIRHWPRRHCYIATLRHTHVIGLKAAGRFTPPLPHIGRHNGEPSRYAIAADCAAAAATLLAAQRRHEEHSVTFIRIPDATSHTHCFSRHRRH